VVHVVIHSDIMTGCFDHHIQLPIKGHGGVFSGHHESACLRRYIVLWNSSICLFVRRSGKWHVGLRVNPNPFLEEGNRGSGDERNVRWRFFYNLFYSALGKKWST